MKLPFDGYGYSRKIIWLKASYTNHQPGAIAHRLWH